MRLTAMAVAVLVAVSCGGDDKPTMGEACDAFVEAACMRAVECNPSASYNACLQAAKSGCCIDDGTCDQPSGVTDAWAKRCRDAERVLSCTDVKAGVVAPQCLMK